MTKNDGTWMEKVAKKGTNSVRENIIVFTFFLFLSFVFWYLNSLGKDLEAEIRFPVKYTNSPKNMTLSEDVPDKLNILLKGPGYSLLKLKMSGNNSPVVIDLSQVPLKRIQDSETSEYYIVTSGLIKNINSQIKSPCIISSVRPDTLFLSFE